MTEDANHDFGGATMAGCVEYVGGTMSGEVWAWRTADLWAEETIQ
jgi:hypothetical protein